MLKSSHPILYLNTWTTLKHLPPESASGVVELCVCNWVCGIYIVHHWPALCTTDLCHAPWCTRGTYVLEKQGDPWHFLVIWWFTTYMLIKVHIAELFWWSTMYYSSSFVLIRWYTRRFFMCIISKYLSGAQCEVISLAGQTTGTLFSMWCSLHHAQGTY